MAKTVEQLLQELITLQKNQGTAPTASSQKPTTGVDLEKAGDVSKKALIDFGEQAKDTLNTFRDMSRTGSNFSNDLVGMSAAAAQSRLDLNEFSQVVKDNGKFLTGMGGSVTRGTEAFAKLSDGFFKSNVDKDLRNLGYSSKELNDVLAMQASIQKFTNLEDEKASAETRASAAAMAREMDMMAKLTGKSRQEQMDIMQKNRVDGQVEAKLRLMTMGKTEEEARKIRTEAMNALKQAELEGRGQMAKELFATGTLISDEATSQFATFGKASQATADQMEAMRRGEFTRAQQLGERATAEMLKNQQDPTLLIQATLGEAGGPIAKTMMKNIETMSPFNDAIQGTAKSMNMLMTTQDDYAKALRAARDEIERSRSGLDRQRTFVGGTVAGATAVERTVQDLRAGVAGAVMARNRQGESISQEASRAGLKLEESSVRLAGGGSGNVQSIIENRARQGLMSEGKEGGVLGGVTNAALTAAKGTVNILGDTIVDISGKINAMAVGGGRSTGSLGATGKLIEDFGEGTLSILHGREGVVTEDQMKNLALGMQQSGATAVADKFAQAKKELSSMDTQKMFSNMIDTEFGDIEGAMAKVTQDIDTEFGDLASAIKRVAEDTPDTEFGDLEGAMSKQGFDPKELLNGISSTIDTTVSSKSSRPAVDLNSINLPGFGQTIKNNAATVPPAVRTQSQQNPQQQTTSTQSQTSQQTTSAQSQSTTGRNDASLNDVVKSLDSLNMLMGKLISQNEDLGRRQISATKSNSSNVYDRM